MTNPVAARHARPMRPSARLPGWVLFACIFGLAVFARTWEYQALPPSLFSDEASIGVDSYYIGGYGIDRNGVSYPTQLIAFGQEQNAFYAYLLLPLIAVWGLRPVVVRLPMLISAVLTLPLVYLLARQVFNERIGLLSMFFLAISPWHILLSRWGLDQNLLPFVFTLAVYCLLQATHNGGWFLAAAFLFGLCFYIYGPSYFIVPFVLGLSLWIILRRGLIGRGHLLAGLAIFLLMALPISAFLGINTFDLPAMHLGPVTIPRVPATPRFLSQADGLAARLGLTLAGNLWSFLKILVWQTDGLIYNAFEPFGYFYKVTFPLALLGIVLLFLARKRERAFGQTVLLLWVSACLIFGVLQQVNINRINTIFIPLLLCTALAVDWLAQRWKPLYPLAILGFTGAFAAFTLAYHGAGYRAMIDHKFHDGLMPAIHYASSLTRGPVCVTGKFDQPYIYVLFSEKPDPRQVVATIRYAEPSGDLRTARSLTRYTFGTQNCDISESPVYVLTSDEIPPHMGRKYGFKFFDEFVVYFPQR